MKHQKIVSLILNIEGNLVPVRLKKLRVLGGYDFITRRITLNPIDQTEDEFARTLAHEYHHWLVINVNKPEYRRQRNRSALSRVVKLLLVVNWVIAVWWFEMWFSRSLEPSFWTTLFTIATPIVEIAAVLWFFAWHYCIDSFERAANEFADEQFEVLLPQARQLLVAWQEAEHDSDI